MSPIIPDADIASFNANSVCVGTPTEFTDQSSSTSGTITNWSWDFGDGSPVDQNQNTTHNYLTPGTYNVSLTIVSTIPCTTTITNQIVVYAFPSVVASANPAAICQGMPTTLTASGATSYSWSSGLGTNNPVTAYPNTTTTYTVTGSENGCSSTASVTVYSGQLQMTASTTNNVSCFGGNDGSGQVTITSGTPPYSYSWTPSGGNGATASNLTADAYTVSVTDSVGCQSSQSITITQPPLLITDISDSTNVQCFGASTGNATVSVSGGTPPYSYNWTPSGGSSATTTGIPAGNYMVIVSDDHGCSAAAQVVISQSPQIQIILNPDDEDCPNTCNGFINSTISGGVPSYTYLWSTSPAQTTANAQNLCPGTYTLTVTDSYNCTMTESAVIATSASATADFIATPVSGYIPLTVDFTYTGIGATNFLWNFGDPNSGTNNSSTLQNPQHLFEQINQYTVILYVNSGPPEYCPDTMSIVIDAIQPSMLVVPNIFTPNGDGPNDEFKMHYLAIETFTCTIFNRWGKEIYEWTDISKGWDGKTKGGEASADGVYYYIIYAKGYDDIEYNKQGTVTLLR